MSADNLTTAALDFEQKMADLINPIHRDGSAKPQPVDITTLLNERYKTHGDYSVRAQATQDIKASIYNIPNGWTRLTAPQREALDMIALKIGRILAGDPDFRDHWADIAGYATLVADRCSK